VKAFGAKYKDDKGQPKVPDALAALAYDAANLLLQGIKEAGADDTAKVKDAMAKLSFNAVSGKITFDANHNPVKSATILSVKDGKVVFNSVVNP
jgi:branched-chain amino acid transport system substrate-binding protein